MTDEELKAKSLEHSWHLYTGRDTLSGHRYWHCVCSAYRSKEEALDYVNSRDYIASASWKVTEEITWLENRPVVGGWRNAGVVLQEIKHISADDKFNLF